MHFKCCSFSFEIFTLWYCFFCSYHPHNLFLQKLIFLDTADGVATVLRPYWSEATGDHAKVVQAQEDMLEIVPPGTSKGNGVRMLIDHLGITAKEVQSDATLVSIFSQLLPSFDLLRFLKKFQFS